MKAGAGHSTTRSSDDYYRHDSRPYVRQPLAFCPFAQRRSGFGRDEASPKDQSLADVGSGTTSRFGVSCPFCGRGRDHQSASCRLHFHSGPGCFGHPVFRFDATDQMPGVRRAARTTAWMVVSLPRRWYPDAVPALQGRLGLRNEGRRGLTLAPFFDAGLIPLRINFDLCAVKTRPRPEGQGRQTEGQRRSSIRAAQEKGRVIARSLPLNPNAGPRARRFFVCAEWWPRLVWGRWRAAERLMTISLSADAAGR